MLATLLEARQSSLSSIAGACTNSAQFRSLVNEATQLLMRRGDWPGLIVPIHVCIKRGCVVFPRYVGNVRKVNLCNRPVPIRNFYESMLERKDYWCGLNGPNRWIWNESRITANGKTPVYSDIMGEGRLLRAYISVQADVGKTVTIFGEDNNGQTIRHKNADGTWSDGVILNLAMPFASTDFYVRRIDRVLKDETNSDVRLYAYDATKHVLEDVSILEPSETNPSLARYQFKNFCNENSCGTSRSIVALIKLAFVPARVDADLVLIENLEALKAAIQSIKFREAGDATNARESLDFAFSELNYSMDDEFPLDQVPVNIQPTAFYSGQRAF